MVYWRAILLVALEEELTGGFSYVLCHCYCPGSYSYAGSLSRKHPILPLTLPASHHVFSRYSRVTYFLFYTEVPQYSPLSKNPSMLCNSFHSFFQHGQSLLWPSWFSPQLPPYECSHHASAGGTFPCQWHLSGGDDDDSQLISVLKLRVTNKLSWGVMPLAKQQPIRILMLPTPCQELCMVQEQQQQHKHNPNPPVLERKSEIWSNELWEHFIGNMFSSVACRSQGFGALWSLSYQKHFLLELKFSAGNYHKKRKTLKTQMYKGSVKCSMNFYIIHRANKCVQIIKG